MENNMKKTGRRLSWITLCSRLTLAAFTAALPGSPAWAQVVERVAPVSAPAGFSAALGTPLSAPSLDAAAPIAGLKALGAAALTAPTLSAAPLSAAAAPAAASVEAVPAQAVAAEAAPANAAVAAPAGRATALDNLRLSGETSNGGSDRIGSSRFDGAGRHGSSDDDDRGSKSRALVPATPFPAEAPVVALTRVIFPGVNTVRLGLSADYATAIAKAMSEGGYMIAATQGAGTAQGHNVAATLVRLTNLQMVDGKVTALMTALSSVKIDGYGKSEGVVTAKVSYAKPEPSDPERMSALGSLAQHTLDEFSGLDPKIDSDLVEHALAETSVDRLTNLLAQDFPFSAEVKVQLLAENSMEQRLQSVILEMNSYFKEKTAKAKTVAGGDASAMKIDTVEGLKAKMTAIGMPADIQAIALKEFEKLSQMNSKDPEAQKLRAYVEWLTDVPWGQRTTDNLDIAQARAILDHDHSGLEKVKERVLEFLALRKKTGSKKGAIIAFTGPPGVGKTSIAAAIAQALGRKFVRLSLGGVHDETVLRGHGRTYLGSMPGEIMRQMKNAGTINPVMLLDEADKIGRNGNAGDPTAALLEILDPAQNNTYRDRYLDVPYDLSEVLFVVTSNELSNIPEPLRDRMEIIEFSGYTTLEKMDIAERHVIPQKLAATGLTAEEATLTPAAIRRIIEGYTMEAGVRTLRERIEAVLRKVSAWTETRGEKAPGVIDEGDVAKYLGVPPFSARQTAQNGVGVATGLAVNTYGGSTLNVEV
ncbi:MAG: AAA family ATPase, partial [Elusimicrobia bacterium]|nr:AAA family ATPase [Elusimicrobiota bacterium]